MTPTELWDALRARDLQISDDEPIQIVRIVERAADASPEDLELRKLLVHAHTMTTLHHKVEPVIREVKRADLIAWDNWTMTWSGHDVSTGRPARVRILRPEWAQDPVARRALARDGALLAPLVTGLETYEDALKVVAGDRPAPVPPLTTWARALGVVKRWAEAGLGLPLPLDTSLCHTGAGLEVLCLTPAQPEPTSETLQRLADWLTRLLPPGEHGPALRLVQRFAMFPPPSLLEVEAQFRSTLREDLVARWHALRIQNDALQHDDRKTRLKNMIHRLISALPPPEGKAAVGVSMEGRTTIVWGDGERLAWGVDDALDPVFEPGDGLIAQTARQLVRARAAAPPSLLLQSQVGGDLMFLDHASRWVAARLRLRTLNLLLKTKNQEDTHPAP